VSQGIAPISLVPVPRVGNVSLPRAPAPRGLLAVARLGLAALLGVTMVAGFAVAMGRTDVPLHALAAVRSPAAVPAQPAETPPARSVAAVPVLKVGTVMNLPLGGVATEARTQSASVVGDILARQAAERAAAQKAAAQRAAAAQQAAQQAAAQRAAQQAAARKAVAQKAAKAPQGRAQRQAGGG
jgi:cytoskeletal protein RodZ